MAKFQKGQSGNPKGRPKGSTNDKTKYIKEWAISLIGSNAKKLSDEFKFLPLKERWKVVSQLMPYVLPKQREIKANVDLHNLSDEQIDDIISEITGNVDTGGDDNGE